MLAQLSNESKREAEVGRKPVTAVGEGPRRLSYATARRRLRQGTGSRRRAKTLSSPEIRPFALPTGHRHFFRGDRLQTITGVNQRVAETVVAEIGANMEQFPSADHLASWAGMCSGNNESAGKRRSGRTTKGDLMRERLAALIWRDTVVEA